MFEEEYYKLSSSLNSPSPAKNTGLKYDGNISFII
jgi:hypothetical protein